MSGAGIGCVRDCVTEQRNGGEIGAGTDGGGGENQKPGHDGGGASPLPQSPNTVSLNGGSIGGTDGGWVPFVKLVRFIAMTATAAVTGFSFAATKSRATTPERRASRERANAHSSRGVRPRCSRIRLDLRQRAQRGLAFCNHLPSCSAWRPLPPPPTHTARRTADFFSRRVAAPGWRWPIQTARRLLHRGGARPTKEQQSRSSKPPRPPPRQNRSAASPFPCRVAAVAAVAAAAVAVAAARRPRRCRQDERIDTDATLEEVDSVLQGKRLSSRDFTTVLNRSSSGAPGRSRSSSASGCGCAPSTTPRPTRCASRIRRRSPTARTTRCC